MLQQPEGGRTHKLRRLADIADEVAAHSLQVLHCLGVRQDPLQIERVKHLRRRGGGRTYKFANTTTSRQRGKSNDA
jgi:hypothetical protein